MYRPVYHIRSNELDAESSSPYQHQPDCENPHQFLQSVRESIVLNHLSVAQMHSNPHQNIRTCLQVIDCFPLNQVKVGSFCFSDPVNRAGCGGLFVSTDCVRWWRWCALLCATAVFTSTFLRDALKTLDEFPEKPVLYPFFLLVAPQLIKALRSHGGVGWEPWRLY
jgi:hypothetical protein